MTARRVLVGCGVLLVLGVVVVVAVFVGMVIGNTNKNKTASAPESTTQGTAKAVPPPTPKTSTGQTQASVGEPVELRNRTLTVNGAERNFQTGQPAARPQQGNEFVRVNLTMENTSSSDNISLNPLEFKLEDSNGVQKPYTPMPRTADAISASEVAPGGAVTGNLIFPAPQGDPSLKLVYKPIGIGLGGANITL